MNSPFSIPVLLSSLLVLAVFSAAQFPGPGGFGGPGFGGPGFGPQGGGPGFGPGGPGGFPGPGGPGFGGPGDFGPHGGFGGFDSGFGPQGFQDEGDQFRQVGAAEVFPGVEINFAGPGGSGGFMPGRGIMPNFDHIDEDEMLLGFLGPVLFSELGDPEDTLGPLCPDVEAIGARARELLADVDFSDACSEVEFAADFCTNPEEQCEGFQFVGPRGPGGEEISCPVDESKLLESCRQRFQQQQEQGAERAQQQCESAWQQQSAHIQQQCSNQQFVDQYRDFRPQFEQRSYEEHREFEQRPRDFPGQGPTGPDGQPCAPGVPCGPGPQPGVPPEGQQPPADQQPQQPPADQQPQQPPAGQQPPSGPAPGPAPSEPAPAPAPAPAPSGDGSGGVTTSASRISGLQVGVGFPGPGGPGGFPGPSGPGFGPQPGFGGPGDFGPQGGFPGPGGPGFGGPMMGGGPGFGPQGGPDFCNQDGFQNNCLDGFEQFKEQNEQRMDQMCSFEAKMMKRGLNMYCKQKERFGDPYDRCIEQTRKGCAKMTSVVDKCKAAATLDGAVELIKRKAKVECARMGLERNSRYAETVSTLEELELDGQTREDSVQLSATRDKIVLSAEELEKIKAEVKADVIKDIMTLLGLNSGQLKAAAEKQREQIVNLEAAKAAMEEICEKVEGEAKDKCDAQLAKMDADIKNLQDEAVSFDAKSGGILGVLGGIAGGG